MYRCIYIKYILYIHVYIKYIYLYLAYAIDEWLQKAILPIWKLSFALR